MFWSGNKETNNSPNPELLSLVQNLDEKPRAGGAESGQEEHALSLRAEACNFMQPPGGRSYKTLPHVTAKTPPPMALNTPPPTTPKTPPPVAPKPPSRGFLHGLVNRVAPSAGIPETPRLQGGEGRGGEGSCLPNVRASGQVCGGSSTWSWPWPSAQKPFSHPLTALFLEIFTQYTCSTSYCLQPMALTLFPPKLPKLSIVRPNPKGLGQPLSRALRLWISCGTSPANLKLPCSVLMRFPRLLDPPPQGLPKLPESRRSADFQLKRPSPLRNPWPPLCLPPEQPLHWMRPSGGQSWPQSLSLAHPLLQSLPGVLGPPPAPVASK